MVLVVEGTIVNLTPRTLEVPRLRFGLRNGSGHEVYAWTALPSKTLLGSGDGLPFRSRLASPPADGRDVIVRFFSRREPASAREAACRRPTPKSACCSTPSAIAARNQRARAGNQGGGAARKCWSSQCSRAASSSPPT